MSRHRGRIGNPLSKKNSPGIEAISLDTNFGYRRLCISLPRLRYLAISDRSFGEREELSEVIVEDAASLERLLLHEVERDNGPSVRITGAEKLKILGYLGVGFPIVELGSTSFKVYRGISFIPISFFKCAKATA